MAGRVVCISRVLGAHGEEVGRLVAERLRLDYLDDEIIAHAAAKGGVSPEDVADVERRKSTLVRVLSEIGKGVAAESYTLTGLVPRSQVEEAPQYLRGLILEVVAEAAARGEVVIAAHGASYALASHPGILRVHVTASPETRARRLAQSSGLQPTKAARAIRDSDASRADYLRLFYDVEAELPTQYDLVVNTDGLSVEKAADLVVSAAG